MPTVNRIGAYRFFFFSNEGTEPPHVHVEREDAVARFWLEPVTLARAAGFRAAELRSIERLVVSNQQRLVEAWHDFFGR